MRDPGLKLDDDALSAHWASPTNQRTLQLAPSNLTMHWLHTGHSFQFVTASIIFLSKQPLWNKCPHDNTTLVSP
jgi:hypothetical protein